MPTLSQLWEATPLRKEVGHARNGQDAVGSPGAESGARTHRGRPGTWEASTPPPTCWAVQPSEGNEAEPRAPRSPNAAVVVMTRGNRPEGPRRAKGGVGARNRWRER